MAVNDSKLYARDQACTVQYVGRQWRIKDFLDEGAQFCEHYMTPTVFILPFSRHGLEAPKASVGSWGGSGVKGVGGR